MKKIATYIAEQQSDRLKALAQRRGVTQAELLRRFLEEGLAREEQQDDTRVQRTRGYARQPARRGVP